MSLLDEDPIVSAIPTFDFETMQSFVDPDKYKRADYQYELILEQIKDFEDTLDDEHEVGIQLASFGQSILMNVTSIGYSNPYLIVFYGFVNGNRSTLIQHMNQLNFLLTAVQKAEPSEPPRRIGFAIDYEE